MATVEEAILQPKSLGPIRNHEVVESVAHYFVENNFTTKERAVLWSVAVKMCAMRTKKNQATIHRLMDERPGFASFFDIKTGRKMVFFEEEALATMAQQQGAKYYPHNTAALLSGVTMSDVRGATVQPAWNLRAENMSGHVVTVPTMTDPALASATTVFEPIMAGIKGAGITEAEHFQSLISYMTTLWENGELQ